MASEEPATAGRGLTAHEADSVEDVAAFHREHYRQASRLQSAIDRMTNSLGRPAIVVTIFAALGIWTVAAALTAGGRVDQPAFAWLELSGTMAALLISMLILVTQRREDQLAERRAQLTLELALLADRKMAKTIALLEELRRDQPDVADRIDAESEDLAKPADPKAVLSAIDAKSGAGGPRRP